MSLFATNKFIAVQIKSIESNLGHFLRASHGWCCGCEGAWLKVRTRMVLKFEVRGESMLRSNGFNVGG